MRFSILVPVYNVEHYLVQCIESVLKQTYNNYELILVDDGSTDQSGAICDQYAMQYPEHIKVIHKENQGVLAARLTGIGAAKGDFCVFIDSDDYVEPTLIESIKAFIQENSLDMLIYSFQYSYDGKLEPRKSLQVKHGTIWTKENKKDLYMHLIGSSELNSIWTKAIRTTILQADPTDYTKYFGKNMGEDLLHSLYPVTAADRIMFADITMYNYRINNEGLSRSFRPSTIPGKDMLHIYEKMKAYLPVWDMEDQETEFCLNARWFNDTMYMFSKYYEYAQTVEAKEEILDYDWNQFLPENAYDVNNNLENENYKKLYVWLQKRDSTAIDCYFKRKQRVETFKKVKREIKACLRRKKSHF